LQLAAEAGVSLAELPSGTGPGGRVIAADVKEFASARAAAPAVAAAAAAAAEPAVAAAAAAAAAAPAAGRSSGFSDLPHSSIRRVIAQRLTASKQTVPHYYLTSEICLDALLALRAELNGELPAEGKISVNDFLIRAAALSCKKVPEVNSSWLESVIRTYDYVDVSVAVAVPDGLITPIVRDAHTKGLSAISR
jgi:pyruvate dehydrogenase E2 component (dihydrolipoamide acetyltransferase)